MVETLPVERLRFRCEPDWFDFETTEALEGLEGVVGQARALGAIRFGMGVRQEGYNLFVLGRPGSGRHTAVRHLLKEQNDDRSRLHDWCYVNNFRDPNKPVLLRLPAGWGQRLVEDMAQLMDELRTQVSAVFESEEYHHRRQQIEDEFEQRQQAAFEELNRKTEENNVRLFQRPGEFTFAPLRDGKVIDAEAFQKLPREEQERIDKVISELQAELENILRQQIPQWRRERWERIRQLNLEFASRAVGHLLAALKDRYREHADVVSYLEAVEQDVIDNIFDFQIQEQPGVMGGKAPEEGLQRYKVNLLIDNADASGLPIVYEDNPRYQALVGRIEHIQQFGALVTDFTLIRAGALHRANGGYLVLDAHKLLAQPFAWEALKRALFSREVHIESLAQELSLVSTVSLEPQPMPLDLKVVLIGERLLYYMLSALDPEFNELFKVAADFDDVIERSPENFRLYARVVATLVRKHGLRHLSRGAVAAVVEQAARLAAEEGKLSTHMRSIADLLAEADYWAGTRGAERVEDRDVRRAIDAQVERLDRVRQRLYEEIAEGTLRIQTEGEVTGQINGLSVVMTGPLAFGVPSRITVTTRLGEGEVVDIEREVEMGGPLHSKGVFILASFLGARYSRDYPLSLSASLTFEQSYSGVEGDSASLAELCALLSSLADAPIRQSLAVTGSVDQQGNVQAIGGVNEKIEGFFDVCARKGLTGDQGVIIPAANVRNLMLEPRVLEAVAEGRFRIHAVERVDEALELLTGQTAGEADPSGAFPEDSLNGRIQRRLAELARIRHAFGEGAKRDGGPVYKN